MLLLWLPLLLHAQHELSVHLVSPSITNDAVDDGSDDGCQEHESRDGNDNPEPEWHLTLHVSHSKFFLKERGTTALTAPTFDH